MYSNILQLLNYMIENDIKHKNIYHINEKEIFIGPNKRRPDIVRKDRIISRLVEYNSQVLFISI